MNRRGFLIGAGALVAAPALVSAASLMPVSSAALDDAGQWADQWRAINKPSDWHQAERSVQFNAHGWQPGELLTVSGASFGFDGVYQVTEAGLAILIRA